MTIKEPRTRAEKIEVYGKRAKQHSFDFLVITGLIETTEGDIYWRELEYQKGSNSRIEKESNENIIAIYTCGLDYSTDNKLTKQLLHIHLAEPKYVRNYIKCLTGQDIIKIIKTLRGKVGADKKTKVLRERLIKILGVEVQMFII